MKLIALVAIAVLVDGVRTIIEPGEEVTGLNKVDIADLKASGSIEDQDEKEAAAKKDEQLDKKAAKEFADARKAVQASQAAIEARAAKAPAA